MDDKKPDNIVDEHRKMMIMTGKVSDFQIENMKKWPFLVFGKELEQASVSYDFVRDDESLHAGSVNYDFKFGDEPKLPEHALNMLTHWTKYLFWEDTEVTFTREGKVWQTK